MCRYILQLKYQNWQIGFNKHSFWNDRFLIHKHFQLSLKDLIIETDSSEIKRNNSDTYIWWAEHDPDCGWHAATTSAIISVLCDNVGNIPRDFQTVHPTPLTDTTKRSFVKYCILEKLHSIFYIRRIANQCCIHHISNLSFHPFIHWYNVDTWLNLRRKTRKGRRYDKYVKKHQTVPFESRDCIVSCLP